MLGSRTGGGPARNLADSGCLARVGDGNDGDRSSGEVVGTVSRLVSNPKTSTFTTAITAVDDGPF